MSCLGIVAALRGEIGPLIPGWRPVALSGGSKDDGGWRGRAGPTECVAVVAGMGPQAAARACALAEAAAANDGGLSGLVSLGWAGALSPGISPGRAYLVTEVVDAKSGERFRTGFLPRPEIELKLVSIDHVARYDEKRQLEERYAAAMVDMEAAAVADAARKRSIPFYCLKAVSDLRDEILPDFSRAISSQGKLEISALLAHLLLRPRYWPAMVRMSKNSRIGAVALAQAMQRAFCEADPFPRIR